jgi:hypothetical protein
MDKPRFEDLSMQDAMIGGELFGQNADFPSMGGPSGSSRGGGGRARAHCRFVLPRIHFIPDSLTYSAPPYLRRQCDRTPRRRPLERRGWRAARGLGPPR